MDITDTATAITDLTAQAVRAIDAGEIEFTRLTLDALRRHVNRLEAAGLDHFRASGHTWQDIADHLGITKQSAHERYHRLK